MSEVEKFKLRLEEKRKQGLVNFHYSLADFPNAPSEEVLCKELNAMLDAIESLEGKPLYFNDSRKKGSDDSYANKLELLPEVERKRLLEGEWL